MKEKLGVIYEPKDLNRQSNFELLRLLCMILIVSYHMTKQTKMATYTSYDGIYYYCLLISSAGRFVCNTFVMIGAWFLTDSEFRPDRIVKLWLEIFFYSVIITIICLGIGCRDANITTLVQAFFPIFGRPVWFGAEYLCLLLLTPWLNEMLRTKNVQTCKKLVKLFGILIVGCATLFPIEHTTPAFSELVWFCFLYLFIGLYKHQQILLKWRWLEKYSLVLLLLGYLLLCGTKILSDFLGGGVYIYYREHYETLLGFSCSFFLFVIFKNWNVKHSKIINWISRSAFAIYIIHQTPAFYRYMWNGIFQVDAAVANGKIIGYSIFVICIIFLSCVCIDNVRIWMMNRFVFRSRAYQLACNRILHFYQH